VRGIAIPKRYMLNPERNSKPALANVPVKVKTATKNQPA